MKLKYLNSASVLISNDDTSILCDPWLIDGEFYGSWYIYPPLKIKPQDFDNVDAIYISHIHPDHFSVKTLKEINKKIPVYIHKFAYDMLRKGIENLGFDVIELEHEKSIKINKKLSLQILASDNCNPEICIKYFGCGQAEKSFGSTTIDSMSVISDGKQVIVNTNDTPYPLGNESANKIKKKYDNIDLLLLGYSSANSYPQCFQLSKNEINSGKSKVIKKFLDYAESYISLFKPKFYFPFAGRYVLGGKNFELNENTANISADDAVEYLNSSKNIPEFSKSVRLNSNCSFDIDTGISNEEYVPLDKKQQQEYCREILSNQKYDYEYEEEPTFEKFTEIIPECIQNFHNKRDSINFKSKTRIMIPLQKNNYLLFQANNSDYEIINQEQFEKITNDFIIIKTDLRLLYNLFKGPRFANWNSAEIGSHLKFVRSNDVYERGLFWCLNYLHS
tara:strand:- start:542 stop:1885 length:1344 start_codon:yes stop_codon:yes gene_type:complete